MVTHVKVLGTLHIIFGALGVFVGLGILLMFGGISAVVGMSDQSGDAAVAIPILGGIAAFLFVLVLILALPGIVAGIGLLQFRSWARTLTIILSAISLLNFPFGTALGIYGLWVLLQTSTEPLFRR
jgi:hypothetical protein